MKTIIFPCTITAFYILLIVIFAGCEKRERTAEQDESRTKVEAPHALLQMGDFAIALASVNREENRASLSFAITKVGHNGTEAETLPFILKDDHDNQYPGMLEIAPFADFPTHLLPEGFAYVKTVTVAIPKAAPIKILCFDNKNEINAETIKSASPKLTSNLGASLAKSGIPTQVGEFLRFDVQRLVPVLYTWAISVSVKNQDYNPLNADVRCGVQFVDGTIANRQASVALTVPGQSQKDIQLVLDSLRGEEAPKPRMLLLTFSDRSSGETVLKLWPISDTTLPPRVGQGTNEAVFIRAYLRNGGRVAMADPLGVPRWFGDGRSPKDKIDLLIQEFPATSEFGKSAIIWDQQNKASVAYVLRGAIWQMYSQLGGPYHVHKGSQGSHLGTPNSDEKVCRSSLGTTGRYVILDGGSIISRRGKTVTVLGRVHDKWRTSGFISGPLGFPLSNSQPVDRSSVSGAKMHGKVQLFEGGSIYAIASNKRPGKVIELHGSAAKLYFDMKSEKGWLGFPLAEEHTGYAKSKLVECEGGYLGSSDGSKWNAYRYPTGRIVFMSNRNSNKEIYVMDARGRNQTNLTNHQADDWDPAWSPDGKKIAFISNRDGNPEIYVMDADGKNTARLTKNTTDDLDPTWFPGTSKIVFSRTKVVPVRIGFSKTTQKRRRLFVMNPDGTNQKELKFDAAKLNIDSEDHQEPAVSADGRRITFTIDRNDHPPMIAIMTVRDTKVLNVYNLHSELRKRFRKGLFSSSSWHPSGDVLVAVGYRGYVGKEDEMYLISPKGTNLKKIAPSAASPSFSPDGSKIVFSSKGHIYALNVADGVGRKLTKGAEKCETPSWTDSGGK